MNDNKEILNINNITKNFLGVRALDNVSVTLLKGEVHALVGENGAGKSTLSKIICGIYGYDSGNILYDGTILAKGDPKKAQSAGIFMIPQDLGLLPMLSVMQNVLLGRENGKLGIIDLKRTRNVCESILKEIGLDIDLNTEIFKLTLAQQQFVALARVLSADARLIILDEPTSTLSEKEVENLFGIIRKLKAKNITMVYISHRLDEIFQIADRVTILKDGRFVNTKNISETNKDEVIKNMVGRELSKKFPIKNEKDAGEVILEYEGVFLKRKAADINLKIYKGEVLGIGGLAGMGQIELAGAAFGLEKIEKGNIIFEGKNFRNISPLNAINQGINFLSSDRRGKMLFMNRSIRENIAIGTLKSRQKLGVINLKAELKVISDKIKEYNIVTSGKEQEVQFLSGGNQQKVILARWLVRKPKLLILDEPTQGIDVGTKEDIYRRIRELADEGLAIIVILSDMIELIGLCDRIAVMHEGRISSVFLSKEVTEEKIMAAASGIRS
jgi:ribose transport system ATP-binding protein